MVEVPTVRRRPAASFGNALGGTLRTKMDLVIVVQIAELIHSANRSVQVRNTARRIPMQSNIRFASGDMGFRRDDFTRPIIQYLLIIECRRKIFPKFFPVFIDKVSCIFFGRTNFDANDNDIVFQLRVICAPELDCLQHTPRSESAVEKIGGDMMDFLRVFLVRGFAGYVTQCIYAVRYGSSFGYHRSGSVLGVFIVPLGVGLGLRNNTAVIRLAGFRSSLSQSSI